MTLTANNKAAWLETIWDALHMAREDCIPEGDSAYDSQWDDITLAMAWITEEFGLELDENGDYVRISADHDKAVD